MDPTALALIVGAALVTIPSWIAWAAGKRAGHAIERRKAAQVPELTCSCGHGYGTHEDGKRCHGVVRTHRNSGVFMDGCPCRLYDGPEPLPRTWTSPMLP